MGVREMRQSFHGLICRGDGQALLRRVLCVRDLRHSVGHAVPLCGRQNLLLDGLQGPLCQEVRCVLAAHRWTLSEGLGRVLPHRLFRVRRLPQPVREQPVHSARRAAALPEGLLHALGIDLQGLQWHHRRRVSQCAQQQVPRRLPRLLHVSQRSPGPLVL
eukprot:Amastigsp_a509954_12.p2 type:complete len:160 gc:universal Amastigsp_a509954_12:1-480(+)